MKRSESLSICLCHQGCLGGYDRLLRVPLKTTYELVFPGAPPGFRTQNLRIKSPGLGVRLVLHGGRELALYLGSSPAGPPDSSLSGTVWHHGWHQGVPTRNRW